MRGLDCTPDLLLKATIAGEERKAEVTEGCWIRMAALLGCAAERGPQMASAPGSAVVAAGAYFEWLSV